ncbi:hypothetical protein ISF_04490 [Cordyceps fumosorosea ARSEF 2679]|uniref:Uncharacterized protein n=1 Tax=Cordyceps fumosorosea (strain ARSEF 2679) TaxID=1081104 RepID=A0A167WH40_CORFA|nr:hypothetical protein ISF_04490 [Cordyceps fumosorosea ARSEF 2679]OAA63781.1 hypothetical protein ISF_04490 [Cordyceps fumosorosea ARSEF 2679]
MGLRNIAPRSAPDSMSADYSISTSLISLVQTLAAAMDLEHVAIPVVLSRERLAAAPRVLAPVNRAEEAALDAALFVAVPDVTVPERLGVEALAAAAVRARVLRGAVPLIVPT